MLAFDLVPLGPHAAKASDTKSFAMSASLETTNRLNSCRIALIMIYPLEKCDLSA